jgi:FKBP-type peptidyl-prolyl cis-trans isomerase (trigger factor)
MIKKLYHFRDVSVPAPLLQAEVTREEMDTELALVAARFTTIEKVDGPIAEGHVVALEYVYEKGNHRIYSNVGKGFDDLEEKLPGLSVGDKVGLRYAGKDVEVAIVSVKRPVVPALTDAHVQQLGIENVANLAALEDHLFEKLALSQKKRKFRGIMGIVGKAVMENTDFEDLEQHPWYLALHEVMMGRVAGFAAQNGISVEEALPAALRMEDKSLEECREALKNMCLERAKQAALGQAYAAENNAEISQQGGTADVIGRYVDYLNEAVFAHFAPQIAVERK